MGRTPIGKYLISDFRDEEEYPLSDNIGACGLHVISGALYTGVVKAGWPIEKFSGLRPWAPFWGGAYSTPPPPPKPPS